MRPTPGRDGDVAAVLLAAGASTRFHASRDKVLADLGGRTILGLVLTTLDRSPHVDHIVLVVRDEITVACEAVVAETGVSSVRAVVSGGATRHESEQAGLEAVTALGGVRWVMLHDAARPFVTHDLLARLVTTAASRGVGVVPGLPLPGPVVATDGAPVDVSSLVTMQTPQLFALGDVVAAYRRADVDGFRGVDTAETVAAYCDTPVDVVPGDPWNAKITTRPDIDVARARVESWQDGSWAPVAR